MRNRHETRRRIAIAGLSLAGVFFLSVKAQAFRSPLYPRTDGFADFNRRARAGEKLNVVFFGASLTWGANSSNPTETSYRAVMAQRFEAAYPRAHFRFFDAAIGGTGSQLGAFRLQRDVLNHHPDLVFLDFSANDDINSDDRETLSSYEWIVRRLVADRVPVVQVIFPFEWNVAPGAMAKMKRRDAHLKISRAYNTGLGDAISLANKRVESKQVNIKTLWPLDGVHPGDKGYQMFADAAFAGFQEAVREKRVSRVPFKMLYDAAYVSPHRVRISQMGALPQGWRRGIPNRTSAYFDFLMSRWLDDEVIASNRREVVAADGKSEKVPQEVERLKFRFYGANVLLFGETTLQTGKYRAYIDGDLVQRFDNQGKPVAPEFDPGAFGKAINGNGHHVQVIATGLNPNVDHTLEIEPIFAADTEQELRFESVCVAGALAYPGSQAVRALPVDSVAGAQN